MKNLLRFMPLMALVLFTCTADSNENDVQIDSLLFEQNQPPCVDDDPITRVVNNGTIPFDLIVLANDGTVLVDIPNIPANTTTSWASFPQGEVLFSVKSNQTGVQDDKVVLQMNTCMAFDIEIDATNQIVSYTPIML
ncbi:hypothetical protein [Winogradskyella flava]|uniref:Uncharacterized protein n=1 Tax=Winogradskyella flava TaxID=1884876 RepID=A0A842IWW4_9FLAO|nr:hypothetical protein [Winogradskyella flava]MBC2845278.1 hypothetical protein [Winogradskyella flava]